MRDFQSSYSQIHTIVLPILARLRNSTYIHSYVLLSRKENKSTATVELKCLLAGLLASCGDASGRGASIGTCSLALRGLALRCLTLTSSRASSRTTSCTTSFSTLRGGVGKLATSTGSLLGGNIGLRLGALCLVRIDGSGTLIS